MKCPTAICVAAFASYTSIASTNLLPGLRFDQPPVKLGGSLVFLYSTNGCWSTDARIYQLDLQKQSLRLITACPGGEFYAAKDGKAFCVLHGANIGWGIFGTNAFMYSDRLHLSRQQTFDQRPSEVVVSNNQVTFAFHNRSPLVADIQTGSLTPTAGQLGTPLVDYSTGGLRGANGRWIFFEGRNAPYAGTRLVSSPLDRFRTRSDDPRGKNVRVLKRFSQSFIGGNWLNQMSPCGGYAFIRRSFPIGDGWGYTYYVVNATNGVTHLLLEDKVSGIGQHRVSEIEWVDTTSSGH